MSVDPEIARAIASEEQRQRNGLEMIASENFPSLAVLEAVGSIFTGKYAEGYAGKRYYAGNEFSDQVELLAIERAKKLFGAEHVNVQPYSGTPANLAIYAALLQLGDPILGLALTHGGHLTHGHKVSFSGKAYKAIQYHVDAKTGLIDYDELEKLANEHKPKLIISGASAYPRVIDWARIGKIAKEVGAYHLADMSHYAGLIAGGVYPSPMPHADVVMSTSHKTLRGPRAAFILCRKELSEKIDKAVFPGMQGGPHINTIAGLAVALREASQPAFTTYAKQVVANAQTLAAVLLERGYTLVTGGTDCHFVVIDLQKSTLSGKQAERVLEQIGITVNANTVPNDPRKPFDPSGVRIGTSAITSRGVKPADMKKTAEWIIDALEHHDDQAKLATLKKEIRAFASALPLPGVQS